MRRLNLNHYFAAIALVSLSTAFMPGCHDGHTDGSCKDIPCGAIPRPNGDYLCEWTNAQRSRAEEDRFVIYQYEWSAEPSKLTAAGQQHVAWIAHSLDQMPYPIRVESSQDCGMDGLRRAAVLAALADAGCPADPTRVICGRPEAEGLRGLEANNVASGLLSNQGGQGASGGGSSFGSSSLGSQGGIGSSSGGGSGGSGIY